MNLWHKIGSAVALWLIFADASAHAGHGVGGGFGAGLLHPILGLDHVAAMVAVGIWGAFLGKKAVWLLPVVFPVIMAFGAFLGIAGVGLPGIEIGIASSALVLGLLILFAVKAPLWLAGILVGIFAIFHGYAHGAELPHTASAFAFGSGFVIATGLLHLGGIAIGLLIKLPKGTLVVRATGLLIAVAGGYFLQASL